MADNFLEKHREEYEIKKAIWQMRKKHLSHVCLVRQIPKPEDEAL